MHTTPAAVPIPKQRSSQPPPVLFGHEPRNQLCPIISHRLPANRVASLIAEKSRLSSVDCGRSQTVIGRTNRRCSVRLPCSRRQGRPGSAVAVSWESLDTRTRWPVQRLPADRRITRPSSAKEPNFADTAFGNATN